ncbi:MAG TPA: hypothetical protein ENK19_04055 [Acidobacteria bacterium]|nr:hypothetical protein [Acidobacteriota bacterium]
MEYYHYVNIFETKGLEYILVICFLITFVLFVRRLDRTPRHAGMEPPPGAIARGPVIVVPEENDHQDLEAPEQSNGSPRGSDPPES